MKRSLQYKMPSSAATSVNGKEITVEEAEQRFKIHWDDSSDEEEEGEALDAASLKKRVKRLVKKSHQQYKKKDKPNLNEAVDACDISLILYLLGVMQLRSQPVQSYWQHLKAKHFQLSGAEFQAFKSSVVKAFAEQYQYDEDREKLFVNDGWKEFLLAFRRHAKYHQGDRQAILKAAVFDVVSASAVRATNEMNELTTKAIVSKIKLPTWKSDAQINVNFDAAYPDRHLQLMAMTLLQNRLTARQLKQNKGGKFVVKSSCHGVSFNNQITFEQDKKSRRDEVPPTQIGAYPKILKGAESKSSIDKFVNHDKTADQRTDKAIARDIGRALQARPAGKQPYRNFTLRLMYLARQVEMARHPGSDLLFYIALILVRDHEYTFKHIFPSDEAQQQLTAPAHPEAFYPMALKNAPKYAAGLNCFFFSVLEGDDQRLIYRYDHEKSKQNSTSQNERTRFAKLQQDLVFRWFKVARQQQKPEELSVNAVVNELCELTARQFSK